jgi:superfamily I DNA and/or RNA helicase
VTQVSLLDELVNDRLRTSAPGAVGIVECSSVDSFQGREKEVVIVSTVRSNNVASLGSLGFRVRV